VADLKISQLTGGGASQAADEYVIARSGNNFKVTGANVAAAATSVGTLTSLTVSGNATFDTNTLFVDATNNRVGVGTATPSTVFEVNGAGANANPTLLIARSAFGSVCSLALGDGTNNNRFAITSATNLTFTVGTSPTTLATLDTGGNLGLGVTPGAWSTSYRAIQMFGGGLAAMSGTGDGYLVNNLLYDGAWKYINTGGASFYRQVSASHAWFSAPSGTGGTTATTTQAMTLDANGNLMVGGTSSYGGIITAQSTATRGAGVGFRNSAGTAAGGIFVGAAGSGGGSTDVYVEAAGFLAFNAGGTTERARIDTSGNLLVGQTSDALTQANRVVFGINGSTDSIISMRAGASLCGFLWAQSTSFGIAANNIPIVFSGGSAGGTERARITTAGSVVAGGSVALATSATDGFLYVPTCAGTPTGTPTAITGMAPIVVDTTNHKLYFRSGGVWRDAGP
jgi:hypothetical protein